MEAFLHWFNREDGTELALRAGIAHLWFVTVHPFEDGNCRIARELADMVLARSEKSSQRFCSISAQFSKECLLVKDPGGGRSTSYSLAEEERTGND